MTPFRLGSICALALIAAGVAAGQASHTPQTGGRALLAGQVVEAGTTRPIAGVLVTLGGTPRSEESPAVLTFLQASIPGGNRRVVTNDQGHFLFTDLPAGTYSIQAEKTGFIPGGYGKSRAQGLPQLIVLGETDRSIDLRISLSRFATITGRVVDEAGEPLIRTTVIAQLRVFTNGRPQFTTHLSMLSGETNDRGEYRIATLVPGDYIVSIRATQATMPRSVVNAFREATAAGTVQEFRRQLQTSTSVNAPSTTGGAAIGDHFLQTTLTPPPGTDGSVFVYPTQFFPTAQSPADAAVITLRAGETRTGIDFHLRPVPTSSVSGVVSGPSGALPHLGLSLVPTSHGNLASTTFFEAAATVTDAIGRFTFLGVPAGDYVLRAIKTPPPVLPPPAAPGTPVVRILRIPEGPTLWASQPISVGRTAIPDVAVTLRNGVRVSGRIVFEGSAAKPANDQLPRFSGGIRLEPLDVLAPAWLTLGEVLRIAIDAEGRLSSYEIPPGRYFVTAGPIPGWTFKSATVGGRDVSLQPMDLQGDVSTLVVTYVDRPSSLGGTVRAAEGTADGSAQVLVFPVEGASPNYAGSTRQFKTARAGASGAYQIPALPAGEYLGVAVAADAAADFPSLAVVRALAPLATRFTIRDAEHRTQDLITVTIK